MLPSCSLLLVVLWASSIAASPQSQTASPDLQSITTFKANAHLVLVDVVVTNNKGEPITGLQKEDFEVLEDGKQQFVSNFEEHKGASPNQIKLPSMPPNVYTNFPFVQTADSINVILLDALNTPTSDQVYERRQMIKYVKTILPRTRVAIFHPRIAAAHVTGNHDRFLALAGGDQQHKGWTDSIAHARLDD